MDKSFEVLGFKFLKRKIFLFFSIMISLSIVSFFLSTIIIFLLETMPLESFKLATLIGLYDKPQTTRLFLLMLLISLSVSLFIAMDLRWYKSREIKITDDITIPARAGENQHGSARFAEKKDYDKLFGHIIFDASEYKEIMDRGGEIKAFIEENKEEIDNQIEYYSSDVSIK